MGHEREDAIAAAMFASTSEICRVAVESPHQMIEKYNKLLALFMAAHERIDEIKKDAARLDWLSEQMVTFENQSLLIIHPSDLRAAIDLAMQDETEENYNCPIHGQQDGPDCARC